MLFEPLAAKRSVAVRAGQPQLQDNLNTHGPHSLYRAFEPQEARRLVESIKWHFTLRHGSWLNMAELELSILARQCLTERMETQPDLKTQVRAWQKKRNGTANIVNWHFTTKDARIKLKSLYPQILRG